jgi:hypothetical protein
LTRTPPSPRDKQRPEGVVQLMLSAQPVTTNGFPAELDDREWLAARYGTLGDETIAAELRVSCKAVRRARERLGIATSTEPVRAIALRASSNGASATGPFVSDEELTRRVGQVKRGLVDTCARLTGLVHELDWVRRQVAPPDVTPLRRSA